MLFSFCFTFNLLIIKKKKKKCAEDSVAVLGHHRDVNRRHAGFYNESGIFRFAEFPGFPYKR